MKNKMPKRLNYVFYSMIAIFILLMAFLFVPPRDPLKQNLFPAAGVLALIFLILGVLLIVFAAKSKLEKKLRIFLILMGSAAVAIPVFAVLHNLVYGLLMYIFGPDFWGENGDEPVFFILAVLVCPIVYLVAMIGSLVMIHKKKR